MVEENNRNLPMVIKQEKEKYSVKLTTDIGKFNADHIVTLVNLLARIFTGDPDVTILRKATKQEKQNHAD